MALLAVVAGSFAPGLLGGCEKESDPADDKSSCSDPDLPKNARNALEASCHRCHGQSEPVSAALDVFNVPDMIARGKVIPGDPEGSTLYKRIAAGEMPPSGEDPRPTQDDKDKIGQWITCGAPDFNQIVARELVPIEEVLRAMRLDIDDQPSSKRKFVRYFSLVHLFNAQVDDASLEVYRRGLSKMVNSLSWGSQVVIPVAIDPPRNTIFRVLLTDYRWDPQPQQEPSGDLWELILASFPFGTLYPNNADAAYLAEETGTVLPWVDGAWFVNASSTPPLYHEMLRLPDTEVELELRLGVDVAANIANELVSRSGFNTSGVSLHNRVIERHESLFGVEWKSYDFSSSLDSRNIFQNPLGPASIPPGPAEFGPDGGEIIFSLPNGLHAFMIADASGGRLDAAPTNIVADAKQPDHAVRSGRSCMGCHLEGINPKEDAVRDHVEGNPSEYSNEVLEKVRAIYPPKSDFAQVQASDAHKYLAALAAAGVTGSSLEPVSELSSDFDRSLDLNRASAELWMTPENLQARINDSPFWATKLGPLGSSPEATVKREVFQSAFADVVCSLGSATPLIKGVEHPCEAPTCSDNAQNGGEAGVDCGGSCSPCASCGDEEIQASEVCDGANLNGNTCQTLGHDGGALSCSASCLAFDESKCSDCGDGAVEGSEACDGADLGGKTCGALGFSGGALACSANCTFNTAGCLKPECSDNTDNDADGFTDGGDPGCSSNQDDDEFILAGSCNGIGGPIFDVSVADLSTDWVINGTTVGAVNNFGPLDKTHGCTTASGGEVALFFRAFQQMTARFSLNNPQTTFDAVLYIRQASCSAPQAEVCIDDIQNSSKPDVTVDMPAGDYFIFIDGFSGNGDFTLLMDFDNGFNKL